MIIAMASDIPLQIAMIIIAVMFAIWAVRRSGESQQLRFTTAMLQALVFQSSVVLLLGIAFPTLFQSSFNQQVLIVMVSMMTLIYSARDLFENIQSWRAKKHGRHAQK